MNKIYIVGTGIAGLSYNDNCQYKDKIVFLEQNNYEGGRIKTINSGNSYFEIGSQFFTKSDENIMNIIKNKDLKRDLVLLDFSNLSFYKDNSLYTDINNIANVVQKIISTPITNKTELFDEWFLHNLKEDDLFIPKAIIKAICFSDSANVMAYYGKYIIEGFFEVCYTLKYGLEEIIKALSKKLKVKRCTVQEFNFKDRRLVEMVTDNGVIHTNEDIVISTAPPGDIKIRNNKEVSDILGKVNFCGCCVIIFKIDKDLSEKPNYVFFHESTEKVAVIEQNKFADGQFIGCLIPYHNSKIVKDEIILYSKDLIEQIFECDMRKSVVKTYYENWIKGLPIVNRNHVDFVDALNQSKFDNLFFIGDYSSLYPSMDSAALSGLEMAQKICANK